MGQFLLEIRNGLDAFLASIGIGPELGTAIMAVLALLTLRYRWNFKDIKYAVEDSAYLPFKEEAEKPPGLILTEKAYRDRLQRMLHWINGKLGDGSWSPQTFDFSLRMALIYPLISLFAIWVATGENTSGIDALLPPASAAQRLLAPVAIAVSIFSLLQYMHASSWIGRISWLIITGAGAGAGALFF
ncbi:MAG: hypothetical protein AAFR90_15030 [Pseudomonadota bacterium]